MGKLKMRIALFIIASMLVPTFVGLIPGIGALTAKEVFAATNNAKLFTTTLEIGVNSSPQYIVLDNYNYSAVYSYKSANDKIAKVSEYGMVQGVKLGKTKVEVTESIGGEATKIGTVTVNVVEPYLDKKMQVGVNSTSYMNINCSNMDATYTYKSANTKIAKVDKYGVVKGIKYGETTISVTQKLKGKSKKLGSIKVEVVHGALLEKEIEVGVSEYATGYVYVNYQNEKATYKFTSSDKKIAKVDEYGWVTGVKLGTTTIKVTETYNKKTVKVGTITIKVVGASLYEDGGYIELGINKSYYVTDYIGIKFMDIDAYYYAKSEDSSIIEITENDDYGSTFSEMKAKKVGTTKLTIYEKKKNSNKSKKLGTVIAAVKEYPVESMNFYKNYDFMEVINGVYTLKMAYNSEYSWYNVKDYLDIQPYYTTTPFTYNSSDEKVVTIDDNGFISTKGFGTTRATVTCGPYSLTFDIIVQEVPVTNLSFDGYYFDYDSKNDRYMITYYLDWDYSYSTLREYLLIDPYNTSDKITYASSDEKIVKVDEYGVVTPVAKGTAIITVTCGKLSTKLTVKVKE